MQNIESESVKKPKRGIIIWIDYIFGVFHFLLMLNLGFMAINNFILAILIFLIVTILFGGLTITFFRLNPFYIYYCYSLVICGAMLSIIFINIISLANFNIYIDILTLITRIAILPEIIYIYKLIKFPGTINILAKFKFMHRFAAYQAYDAVKMRQYWEDGKPEERKKQREYKEALEAKYKMKTILIINFICSIAFTITFFISLNL